MTYHHKAVNRGEPTGNLWFVVCEEVDDFEEGPMSCAEAVQRAAVLNRRSSDAMVQRRYRALDKFDTGDQDDTG